MIQAILFDLDGVLVDATEWHYQALNQALSLFGTTIARPEHMSVYNGLPTRAKLKLLTSAGRIPAHLQELVYDLKQSYTETQVLNRAVPDFTKEYMLRRLRNDGYRLAVCSNAIRRSVELMLERTALAPYVEFFLSNEDVTKPKPEPEIYLTAMAKLGLAPAQVLVIEDAPPGIEAARRAGAQLCQVSSYSAVNYQLIKQQLDASARRA